MHTFFIFWNALVVNSRFSKKNKQPVQLDLFTPYEYGFDFKVILTNKSLTARKVTAFHNGRGGQENIFSELKSQNQLGYIPTRTWCGNKIYMLAVLIAHNLNKELQMIAMIMIRKSQRSSFPWLTT